MTAQASPTRFSFSVIIATKDQRQHVGEALRSVTEQTESPEEVIVVDDGSTDDTASFIQSRFPSVILVSQPPRGQSIARNTAIAKSRADWLCFLDHDDLWHRDKLAKVTDYLSAKPKCEALNHPVWFFSSSAAGPLDRFGFPRDFVADDLEACHKAADALPVQSETRVENIFGFSYPRLLATNVAMPSAVVARRDLVIRAGCFPPGHAEDWRLFRNMARLAEWHTLPERLTFARLHDAQATKVEVSSLYRLVACLDAWYGGRVFPDRASEGLDMLEWLTTYRYPYRQMVQEGTWDAIRQRQWRLAALNQRLGGALLPLRRDRLFTMLPRRVTERWSTLVG